MSKYYVLAKGAVTDLKEIARYTHETWGEAQCYTYIDQLEQAAMAVSKNEGVCKDLSAIYPQLRMIKSGHHYIFCCPRHNDLPIILAILHERMDIMKRLKNRLS